MLHNRFKLIHHPATIIIDRQEPHQSDIEEEDIALTNAALLALDNHKKRTITSLLSSVNLKGRKEPTHQCIAKQEAVVIDQDNEDQLLNTPPESEQDSQSLVFIKKKTTPDCLKKKLRRLATVPNKLKLEGRDQNSTECSICLTDLKQLDEKQIGRLNCKHIFCFACILESSKFSNRCPYCRASFSMIRHGKKTTHVAEARLNQEFDDPMDEPCYICGRNDDFQRLLECQYCEYAYCHTYCDTRLNSDQPPAGHWYCLSCEELLRNQINLLDDDDEDDDEIFEDEP